MALTMNMSDYDLTDRYADERSSVASSQAGRHPRGDSPLTIYKSDTDGSVTGGSSRGSCSGRTTVELPSLDRLMAFLDDDEENDAAENDNTRPLGAFRDGQGVEEAGMVDSGRSIDTERRASPLRSPQRTELDQQPLSSTPPLSAASATQRTRALNQELPRSSWDSQRSPSPINGDANGTRPSRSPPASHSHVNDVHVSSSYLRPPPLPPHSQSAPSPSAHGTELTEGATRTEADGISHTAGSPSPRPGSMAELRRSLSALGVRESDVDDEPGHGHDERGHPDERDARQRERSDGEDSVTRLAEDVMQEFESIVSRAYPDSNTAHDALHYNDHTARPPSRLRNIPSPARTDSATEHNPLDLLGELRAAREHISRLQNELRTVSSAVVKLRGQDGASGAWARSERAPNQGPEPRGLSPTDEATLKVAQHLLAVHSLSSSSDASPDTNTIALALDFTRHVDAMVYHSTAASGREAGRRRDEAVFTESNLAGVMRRLRAWEQVARSRAM